MASQLLRDEEANSFSDVWRVIAGLSITSSSADEPTADVKSFVSRSPSDLSVKQLISILFVSVPGTTNLFWADCWRWQLPKWNDPASDAAKSDLPEEELEWPESPRSSWRWTWRPSWVPALPTNRWEGTRRWRSVADWGPVSPSKCHRSAAARESAPIRNSSTYTACAFRKNSCCLHLCVSFFKKIIRKLF